MLNQKLANLKGPRAKVAIRKASRTALRPVAADARATAPKLTGRLSRSIKVRALKRSRRRVGSRVTSSGDTSAFRGRTFYGGFQEYGWQLGRRTRNADLGIARGRRRTAAQAAAAAARNAARRRIPGTRWLQKSARRKRQHALAIYNRETRDWIRRLTT